MKQKKQIDWARTILGILLLLMATGQILSFTSFIEILGTYKITNGMFTIILGIFLIISELIGAGILITSLSIQQQKLAGILALTATVLWTILGLQAFLRGLHIPNCGCFGNYLAQPLRWWILLEDIEFVFLGAVTVWAIYTQKVFSIKEWVKSKLKN